jgi:hypothetical protein
MKLTFDIDCTPEELRGFFGLPEVKPMQDRLMAELEERMRANFKALDPETMMKTWLPAGMKGGSSFRRCSWRRWAARERNRPGRNRPWRNRWR